MNPRRNTDMNGDHGHVAEMAAIRATLEGAARERTETRDVMQQIQRTLSGIEISLTRLTTLQELGEKRLEKIEHSIGQDDSGLGARMTKIEGLQMLDESEVAALTSRVTAMEGDLKFYNRKFIAALASAVIALGLFALQSLGIIHS